MARVEPLTVWRDGTEVATITGKRPFDLRLAHTRAALERWGANRPVVSCSARVSVRSTPVTGFLRGYLPEGPRLDEAARRLGTPVTYTADLVRHYGDRLPGALVILPAGQTPSDPAQWSAEPLTPDALTEAVLELPHSRDGEISIQGFQDKMALVRDSATWSLPSLSTAVERR